MINRKGQAAMEFLMTYGWAILAAVIVIGVLAYFGVFSPKGLTPTICTMSNPFGCTDTDFELQGTANNVVLDLTNGRGDTVYVQSITVSNCGTGSGSLAPTAAASCPNADGAQDSDGTWYCPQADGSKVSYVIPCANVGENGDKFTGSVTVNYEVSTAAGSRELTSTGKVSGTVNNN